MKNFKDEIAPKGRVEIFVTKGRPALRLFDPLPSKPGFPAVHARHELDFSACAILSRDDIHNIIVNDGKDRVIESLTTGFIKPICRMAVGDRGTIPADPTVPKIAVTTQTSLFNEVYRDDVDATILDIGTPTKHEAKFIKTFSAVLIPITAFSNQAKPVVNEVCLVTADLLGAQALPRAPVAAPTVPLTDERMFAIRTFKSVPFEAANEIAVTIRYTIYIE